MRKFSVPSYRTYNVLYLIVASLILTLLLRGKATHPGVILGLVSIVFGIQLIAQALKADPLPRLLFAVVLIVIEIIACFVVGLGSDAQELWLSTWYAISSILLGLDVIVRRLHNTRNRHF